MEEEEGCCHRFGQDVSQGIELLPERSSVVSISGNEVIVEQVSTVLSSSSGKLRRDRGFVLS